MFSFCLISIHSTQRQQSDIISARKQGNNLTGGNLGSLKTPKTFPLRERIQREERKGKGGENKGIRGGKEGRKGRGEEFADETPST